MWRTISFHFVLPRLGFISISNFECGKFSRKKSFLLNKRNYKVSSQRIDGWRRSLFNVPNFVKRGIKILDILGLSNAVRQQQQQQQQNGAHDWVAHSTRKSQHTHTHTLRYIYRYRYICLSAFLYVSIIILCYLQASFLSQATSKVKSFPERSENGTQEENLVQK